MSEKANDGGPAFPETWHPMMGYSPEQVSQGMTLRDYFAAHIAATGQVSRVNEDDDSFARRCYEVADALLRVRGQR